jgi:hypothetical protein
MNLERILRHTTSRALLSLGTACGIALQCTLSPAWAAIDAGPPMAAGAVDTFSSDNGLRLNGGVTSNPEEAMNRVDDLTRKILLKEVELERFNLVYKRETTKQGRFKGLRYATLQEVNFSLNLANGIISTGERGQHFTNPAKVSAIRIGAANAIGAAGSFVGAGAAAAELGILGYHDIEARIHGYSAPKARAHVLALRNDIDNMLAERAALIKIEDSAPLLQGHAEVDAAEGKVLRDMTALSLFEYSRFHAGSARYLAFQQALFSFDCAKFTCSGIGSIFAYLALHKHDRRWNARAGYMFLVSGALIVATPFAARAIGAMAAKVQKHKVSPISQGLENTEVATLEKDQLALDTLCKAGKCSPDQVRAPLARATVYSLADQGFQDQLHQNLREQRAGTRVATQNYLSALTVGGLKIASGAEFTVVGRQDAVKTDHANRVTNYNLFVAAVESTVGSGIAVLDTARIQVQAEINRRKMKGQGLLPGQLLNARLAKLDNMEQALKADAATPKAEAPSPSQPNVSELPTTPSVSAITQAVVNGSQTVATGSQAIALKGNWALGQ